MLGFNVFDKHSERRNAGKADGQTDEDEVEVVVNGFHERRN